MLALAPAVLLSMLAHGAILAVLALVPPLLAPPSSERVLVAKLVRLGPKKDERLLPEQPSELRAPPPPEPPANKDAAPLPTQQPSPSPQPQPAPAPAPRAPARPSPRRRAPSLQTALARLKARSITSPKGAAEGDAAEEEAGHVYAAELYRCIKQNYVIEGLEVARVAGRRAVVLVYVQVDGKIARHRIVDSSGLPAFDQAVSRAVARCGRISAPPLALRDNLRREGMEIEFVP